MKSTVDRFASDPLDQNRMPFIEGDPSLDVPGILAGRIGDMYASEERTRRTQRTERLMRQASEPAKE